MKLSNAWKWKVVKPEQEKKSQSSKYCTDFAFNMLLKFI